VRSFLTAVSYWAPFHVSEELRPHLSWLFVVPHQEDPDAK